MRGCEIEKQVSLLHSLESEIQSFASEDAVLHIQYK